MNQTEKIENAKDLDSSLNDLEVSEERADQAQGGALRGGKVEYEWKVEEPIK